MAISNPTAPTWADGFGPIGPGDLTLNGAPWGSVSDQSAIVDALLERSIAGASTITITLTDPFREILNSGVFSFGVTTTLDGLNFTLVQFAKASDQLQLTFEAWSVFALRQQVGVTATTTTVDIAAFAQSLVSAVPGVGFVGDFGEVATTAIACGRGTSDPLEDSWTCLQRIASTAGWRCFESNDVIYFGTDQFFLGLQAPGGPIQEFTVPYMNADFDYDVGKPYGNMTVTAATELWAYPPGTPVQVDNVGPASGVWLVYDMQRDMYNPQATITLYVPMTPLALIQQTTETSEDLGTAGGTG